MRRTARETLLIFLLSLFASSLAHAWTNQSPLVSARVEGTAVEYNNELYLFNGFSTGLQVQASIEKYNKNSKQWSYVGSTSVAKGNAVTHNAAIVIGDEVWLFGGRIGAHPGRVSDTVWIYNFIQKNWRQGPKLPVPMAGGGAALVNQTIHLFGGMDANAGCDVNFHFTYNLNNTQAGWKNITASAGMPQARNHFSTVVVNNVIYALGGQNGHDRCPFTAGGNVALVHAYTPATNQWKRLTDLPAIESHNEPSTFEYNGFIYTVGGAQAGTNVLRFDPALNQWEHIVNLPEKLIAPIARIVQGKLLVGGGGAPRAALPTRAVRSLAHAKFNDTATGFSTSTTTDSNTNTSTNANTDTTTNTDANSNTDTHSNTDSNSDSNASLNNQFVANTVTVEAELYHQNINTAAIGWADSNKVGADGGKAMQSLPNAGVIKHNSAGSPKLSYKINFPHAGKYYLWVRGWGDENANGQGNNDSIHAGINGVLANTADKIDGFPSGWHWSARTRDGVNASIDVPSAGIHSIDFWMREDGFIFDKFALSTQATFNPTTNNGDAANNEDNTDVAQNDTTDSNQSSDTQTDNSSTDTNNSSTDTNANTDITETTSNSATNDSQNNSNTNTASAAVQGTYGIDAQGLVAIEVEDYLSTTATNTHQWQASSQAGASGGSSMQSLPNSGAIKSSAANNIMLSYAVNFTQPGVYYVWMRGWGDENANGQGHNDSVHVGLNSVLGSSADKMDGFPPRWNWSRRTRDGQFAQITVPSAGMHTVNIWMREDGFIADKLILTKNVLYTPTGIGPASTQLNVTTASTEVDETTTNVQNVAPVVNAGSNALIMLNDNHQLNGTVSDDGLPQNIVNTVWTKQSGPGSVNFADVNALNTAVTFSTAGGYVLKLSATDTALSQFDTVSIIVEATAAANENQTPNSSIDSTVIVIEAENYISNKATPTHQWVNAQLPNASGNASMITTPNSGALKPGSSGSPSMSYPVNFPSAGEYTVWIRAWGDEKANGQGNNDSIHAGLNGSISSTADKIDGFPAGWHWSKRTRDGKDAVLLVPNAGFHSFNLWMREDGLAVDKILLTKDKTMVPTGFGDQTQTASVDSNTTNSNSDSTSSSNQNTEQTSNSSNTQSHTSTNSSITANAFTAWDLVQTVDGSAVVARHETGAVAVNQKIYVLGGRGNRPVQSYDTSTNKWQSHGTPPVEMHHFQPIEMGGKIYVIGAMKDNSFPVESALEYVYEFDTATNVWRRGPAIPANRLRGSVGAATYNGKIYLVGGNTKGHSGPSVKWFDEYDPNTEQWRVLPDAPRARDHASIAVVNNKLVVAAGRRSAHPNTIGDTEAQTDVYNFSTGQWENVTDPIPTQRAGTMAVAVGEEVIVIGGESWATVDGHRDVEAYNVINGTWRKLQPLLTGRHSGGAAVVADYIHVITGNASRGGGNETSSHEILKLD